MRSASAQHRSMLAAVFGTVFLVFFALSPLRWVELGMPWLTLVITFVLIPLLDAAVGRPSPLARRNPPAFARWIPRLQLPLQAVLQKDGLGCKLEAKTRALAMIKVSALNGCRY